MSFALFYISDPFMRRLFTAKSSHTSSRNGDKTDEADGEKRTNRATHTDTQKRTADAD